MGFLVATGSVARFTGPLWGKSVLSSVLKNFQFFGHICSYAWDAYFLLHFMQFPVLHYGLAGELGPVWFSALQLKLHYWLLNFIPT